MAQDVAVMPIFARHETFHPRFGWLKKGFDKASEDEAVFTKKSASVVLGVGKNMVKAIRYWCIAFKIVEERKGNGKSIHRPTGFGKRLLSDGGLDPFLEDPASLWLLHWSLIKAPCYAPAWYFAYNEFNKVDFSSEELTSSLREFRGREFPDSRIMDSSLKKDANCLLRMYAEKMDHKDLKEDSLACPFTDLALIGAYSGSKRFIFNSGGKPNLPPEIVVSACLEFAASFQDDARTVSISRLLYDAGSPGQAFKLTESSLGDAIETVTRKTKGIYLTETAGLSQLAYDGSPSELSDGILDSYFRRHK